MRFPKLALIASSFFLLVVYARTDRAVGPGDPTLYRHYKGIEAYGAPEAWKMGVTGKGVNVAVIDSGVDFGAPDLLDSQARVTAKDSPYYGWPIVIDPFSLSMWQKNGMFAHQYVDTASTDTKGWTVTGTSKSGTYHIGRHPDRKLSAFYGEPVRVLLADEHQAGVYDTVYVDLNNNHDFRDDKPCRRGDETAVWDRDRDGLPDESGGLIYFIADGRTPPPLGRLLFGDAAKAPKNGELVAFHFDEGSHGTMCAGTIAARGRVVKGLAPEARLVAVVGMGANEMVLALLSAVGYDGVPGTGDEANVISRSAGFDFPQKGGDELSGFFNVITTKNVPNATFVYASANEGSGYATCTAPSSPRVITAGGIIDLWFKGSSNRGDVTAFSSRGPNGLGQVKPFVLGTGAFAPRVRPLDGTHVGSAAYDMHGGGTSDATPHVAGVTALIYQAYKIAHGEFPQSDVARDLLMSSADDINEDVFAQGAGIINARRGAELALGRRGVLVRPAVVSPEAPLAAGSSLDLTLSLEAHGTKVTSATPQQLVRTGRRTFTIPAGQADRLFAVPGEAIGGDLLRISSFVAPDPRARALVDTASTGYWMSAYNWRDRNRDGRFGPQPAANLENAQAGELELLSNTDWGPGSTAEVRIHDPRRRVGDGLLIGLKHTAFDPGGEKEPDPLSIHEADVTIVVESFTWKPWGALQVRLAGNSLRCRLQAPQETGIFAGRILLARGGVDRQIVPVSFSTHRPDGVVIAGTDSIFENDRLYARLEGSGRFGYRDARFYPLFSQGRKRVAVTVKWEEAGSDMDLALFAPGKADTAKAWEFPAAPPIAFPEVPVLADAGHTTRRISTVHPLERQTEKTLVGTLEQGVNLLGVTAANSARGHYGEKIEISVKELPALRPEARAIEGVAGKTVQFKTAADAILGFGEETRLHYAPKPFTFEGRQGDRVVLRPGEYFFANLHLDSNRNGEWDEGRDEVIFSESATPTVVPNPGEVIVLPRDGTYFLCEFDGRFYHLKHRWASRDGIATLPMPRKAGRYVAVAEKDGATLDREIDVTVKPGDATRVRVVAPASAAQGTTVQADLQVVDAFDNPVAADLEATVVLGDGQQKVQIKAGMATAQVKVPRADGALPLQVRTTLGHDFAPLKISAPAPIEILGASFAEGEWRVRLANAGPADATVTVHATPAQSMPVTQEEVDFSAELPFFYRGYRAGYLPLSGRRTLLIRKGEERDATVAIEAKEGPRPDGLPYLLVVTDDKGKVLSHRLLGSAREAEPARRQAPGDIAALKDITEAVVNEPMSFRAEGVVCVRLNEQPPLFLLAPKEGALSIIPDEPGALTLTCGERTQTVKLVEARAPQGEGGSVSGAAGVPTVTDLKAVSEKGGIRLSWSPSRDTDVVRYVVYRVGGTSNKRLDETSEASYLFKAELWNSYTFRVAAVTKGGKEGALGNVCARVHTPVEAAAKSGRPAAR